MKVCERCTDSLLHAGIGKGVVIHPDAVYVLQVLHLAHGIERNQDLTVGVIVAAFLHLGRKHTDHFEAHAIEAYLFPDWVASGKQFVLCL